jgi:hypothetical protein
MVLHLQHADDPPRPDSLAPLARFFALAWRDFLEFQAWDGPDLMEAIATSGLGEYRHATSADLGDNSDYEVGDPILVLTDAGREAIEAARRAT